MPLTSFFYDALDAESYISCLKPAIGETFHRTNQFQLKPMRENLDSCVCSKIWKIAPCQEY